MVALVTCKDGSQKEITIQTTSMAEIYFVIFVDLTEPILAEKKREKLINELKKALKEIKTLKGILPICSFCKKIRDDKGYWNQLEAYIDQHSDAAFVRNVQKNIIPIISFTMIQMADAEILWEMAPASPPF